MNNPFDKLPAIGQRVQVICMKEMIYKGNGDNDGSDWLDDGEGKRGIFFWSPIENEEQKKDEKK